MSKIEVNTVAPQCGTTLTLGESGDTVSLGSGASQSGFGRTGTVDWITTPKTVTFTAVSGEGYFLNTTLGIFTVNLPAGTAGSIVSLADYAGTWQTNKVTVTPNGTEKLGGLNESASLNTEGQSVTFVYVDSTQGWLNTMDSTSNVRGLPPYIVATVSGACNTLTTVCTNYKVATFKGPGTFCVSATAACATDNLVDYVVVAGGGGGGTITGNSSGGGGAGGFRFYANTSSNPQPGPAQPINNFPSGTGIPVSISPYTIDVGGGGQATAPASNPAGNGNVSTFSSVTSAGGGGGGNGGGGGYPGNAGGSGGGGTGGSYSNAGGAGNTPPVSPAQGFGGGSSPTVPGSGDGQAGGGGGALGTGTTAIGGVSGGPGGVGGGVTGFGTTGESNGGFYYFSGGGGGAPTPGGVGGLGGGGNAAAPPNAQGCAGTINTGGGGAGFADASPGSVGAQGGSGIVIIRYKFQ